METGSINDNFRNAFYFATNLHTFLAEQVASVLLMSFGVPPSIHKKSKLQTTNYCSQKLPFRCFWVLSLLQRICFSFINNAFVWQSKLLLWKNVGTISTHQTRGRNTRKLGCLHLHFKNSPPFQKTKKTTQKLFV